MNPGIALINIGLASTLLGSLGLGLGLDVVAANGERQAMTAQAARQGDGGVTSITAHRRGADGLFYVRGGVINGGVAARTVRFVIDTGANVTVLTRRDAARLGLKTRSADGMTLQTVGGKAMMQWARLTNLSIAGHAVAPVDVAVADDDLPTSLLGQDILGQFGSVTLKGDELTIE